MFELFMLLSLLGVAVWPMLASAEVDPARVALRFGELCRRARFRKRVRAVANDELDFE